MEIARDIRIALRSFSKQPLFVLMVVSTLALGIGANTAIFAAIYAVLLKPLPYPDAEELLVLWDTDAATGSARSAASGPNYLDWRDQNTHFESIAAINDTHMAVVTPSGPERHGGARVTGEFFQMLGRPAALGRTFSVEEDRAGERLVVLSHDLARRLFGSYEGRDDLLGEKVVLDGTPYTLTAIMGPDFKPPLYPEIAFWVPMGFDVGRVPRGVSWLTIVGRLADGVTPERAQTAMTTVAQRLAQEYPNTNEGRDVKLVSLHDAVTGSARRPLWVMLGAVGILLLIACANAANLMFIRAASREREVALRTALGAGRWRLLRQLLTESTLLTSAGAVVGLLLAVAGVRLITALNPGDLPRAEAIQIDWRVLAATAAVALLTGILTGLAPAFHASRTDLRGALQATGAGSTSGTIARQRFRESLVVSEIALTLVLLVIAGLLLKSFRLLREVEPGFQPVNVLTTQIDLPDSDYPDGTSRATFFERALEEIGRLPGVTSASAVSVLPTAGVNITGFSIEGLPPNESGQQETANFRIVAPGYFRAMGIPLQQGRAFTEADREEAEQVAIVDDSLARRYWPDASAVGQRISFQGPSGPWFNVVGVVGGVRLAGLDSDVAPTIYTSLAQRPRSKMTLLARTASDPTGLARPLREAIWSIDPNLPTHSIKTLEQILSESLARPRFNSSLIGFFAVLALILASVGVYGVLAYHVSKQKRDIGLRMALGAQRGDVVGLVAWRSLRLTLIGIAIGLFATLGLTRLVTSLLFGVSPADPLTLGAAVAVLAVVALLAAYIPAYRASRIQPSVALQYE